MPPLGEAGCGTHQTHCNVSATLLKLWYCFQNKKLARKGARSSQSSSRACLLARAGCATRPPGPVGRVVSSVSPPALGGPQRHSGLMENGSKCTHVNTLTPQLPAPQNLSTAGSTRGLFAATLLTSLY